ncbi:MAG: hypothetical protein IJU86_04835, partial [Firmicutes bacterium]|nr:hypothetical protein [Bacillota bacterium]
DNRSELTDYQLGILQKMALEYLIDTLGKDIKIFDVLNKLIDETKNLGKYNIGANDKVDEATTLSKDMSKILVDKVISESFPEPKKKDQEDDEKEEDKEIKIFEADKKIRCASIFVKLMRFKIDDNEEKRLFNVLRAQQKKQKLEYEEAKKKKEEEKRRKEEEEKKKKEEEEKKNDEKHNENNNLENKKDTEINIELKKNINEDNKRKEEEEEERRQNNLSKPNDNNTIDNKENNENNNPENKTEQQRSVITTDIIHTINTAGNNQNEKTTRTSSTLPKQIENPINKKNILIKLLAWFLSLVFVSLCIYFFIQAAIAKALITLILTIIFVVASILLTIYLPNKKEQNIDTIKTPLSEEIGRYNRLNDQDDQPQKQIIEERKK